MKPDEVCSGRPLKKRDIMKNMVFVLKRSWTCLPSSILLLVPVLLMMSTHSSVAQESVTIAIWGDSRENAGNANVNIADILLNQITEWDIQIHLGDLTRTGSTRWWKRALSRTGMDALFVRDRFFMCTSNHEYFEEGDPKDTEYPYNRFTHGILPVNGADGSTHFYHHQYDNVHIVACDPYFTDPDIMNAWLDTTLTGIPEDDWLIGFWHAPCYDDITYKSGTMHYSESWLEMFQRHGGDFILHGHAHTYVRSHPLSPDGTVDHDNGMVHIINGCGGASWKEPQAQIAKTAFTPSVRSFPCLTILILEGDTATIRTIDARPRKKLAVIDEWIWERL